MSAVDDGHWQRQAAEFFRLAQLQHHQGRPAAVERVVIPRRDFLAWVRETPIGAPFVVERPGIVQGPGQVEFSCGVVWPSTIGETPVGADELPEVAEAFAEVRERVTAREVDRLAQLVACDAGAKATRARVENDRRMASLRVAMRRCHSLSLGDPIV